jgi:hypothetical protein
MPIHEDRTATDQLLQNSGIGLGERADVLRGGPRDPISRLVRQLVYRRDRWTCQRCGAMPFPADPARRSGALHLDHIIPWSALGSDRSDNLRTYCGPCNAERSNRVSSRDQPSMPIVGICVPCHPRIAYGPRPPQAFDVYCGHLHHIGWAVPGWQIL